MKLFNIIPQQTADVRLRIEADTLEQLFVAGLDGMNNILKKNYDLYLDGHAVVQEFSIGSVDQTSLLVDFLSNVLTLSYVNKAIFYDVLLLEIEDNSLHVHLLGTRIDKFDKDIKGVTYHGAQIIKNKNGNYETAIIFDI